MDVDESRLATLLRELVPEPPETITEHDVLRSAAGAPRRRWLRPTLAAAGAAAAVLAAVGIATLAQPAPDARTTGAGSPGANTTAATVVPCAAAQLTARQVAEPKVPVHPGLVIAVTNTGPAGCTLHGYPAMPPAPLKAGAPASDDFAHGVQGYIDAPPRLVMLAAGGSASFALGNPADTAARATRMRLDITDLSFLVPGDTRPIHLALPDDVRIVGLVGARNVGVTAFVTGSAGPPLAGH